MMVNALQPVVYVDPKGSAEVSAQLFKRIRDMEELDRRGVRFLPEQVLRQARRKRTRALLREARPQLLAHSMVTGNTRGN